VPRRSASRLSGLGLEELGISAGPGEMLPLDETNNGPKLTYQGDSEQGPFYGRMFHKIVGFDGYFFKYAGQFETDTSHRGFDCITYAGTTCGAPVTSMGVTADMAAAVNATKCTLEKPAPPPPTPAPAPVVQRTVYPDGTYVDQTVQPVPR